MANSITYEQAHEWFEYKDGCLFWKKSRSYRVKAGQKAGTIRPDKRYDVIFDKKKYLLHRLIFLMFNKFLPEFVDHIDNNPENNKIENLRGCSRAQNNWNRKIQRNATSGVKGVSWHKKNQKWYVRICVNGKRKDFGMYNDLELAQLVANEARHKYHKEFANHGYN